VPWNGRKSRNDSVAVGAAAIEAPSQGYGAAGKGDVKIGLIPEKRCLPDACIFFV
jgi:hypothetical protein